MTKLNGDLRKALSVPFEFTERPSALPGDLRPDWRLPILLLIIGKCWGGQANLRQLHVLNWAVRSPHARRAFVDYLEGRRAPDATIVRIEPSLNRAISFALGEGLVERNKTDRLILTERGRLVAEEIDKADDCLVDERKFLKGLRSKISQAAIDQLLDWGRGSA